MNTLLVIDMQNAWLNGPTSRFDRAGVIRRINAAAEHIRTEGGSVVFVRHALRRSGIYHVISISGWANAAMAA